MILISPSIPANDFDELLTLVDRLKGEAAMLQIDIVDGMFAPFVSWPFSVSANVHGELKRLAELPRELKLEIDCMVRHPEQYLGTFTALGVGSVIVHLGSTSEYDKIIAHAKLHGYQLGLALTSDSDLDDLFPYIDKIDFVQVMGIKAVGRQGQPYDERTVATLKTLHGLYPTLPLVVDGAVSQVNATQLIQAGATRLAPGSAIAKAVDPQAAYLALVDLVN